MPYESRHGILVVDDDQSQLTTIRDLLEMENYEPVCCNSASVALDAIKEQELDVAILDLKMPDTDGISLMNQLKSQNADMKVIINTAYSSTESAMAAVNANAFAYVEKMGDVGELLDQVQRAFDAQLRDNDVLNRKKDRQIEKLKQSNAALKQEIEKLRLETKRHEKQVRDVKKQAENSHKLSGMQRVCSACHKIKVESGKWVTFQEFVEIHANADFARGFCLTCGQQMLEDMKKKFQG